MAAAKGDIIWRESAMARSIVWVLDAILVTRELWGASPDVLGKAETRADQHCPKARTPGASTSDFRMEESLEDNGGGA